MTRYKSSIATAVVAMLPLAAALAQEKASEEAIQEIIVTAQKRESSVQDVPFSVGVQTADQIRQSGASSIVDLARNVSGLTITDLGPGQSQVAIRGISAGQVVRDQPGVKESVGIYLDESAISVALFTPDLDLFDLERIEVLRGPQGTLFGAGSSSGTLRYITAQPNVEAFGGSYELTASDIQGGEFGGNAKAAVNIPLSDTAAIRVVGYYDELGGFIDSIYPDRATRHDVNSGKRTGGRIALLFQPNEQLAITPRFVYQQLDTDGYPRIDDWNILGNPYTTTQTPVTAGKREQVTQLREGLDDNFRLADLKITYDFGPVSLTSISTYTNRDVTVLRDASQLTGSVSAQLGGTPAEVRLDSPLYDITHLKAKSQELRFESSGDNTFDWLVGAFYQKMDRTYGQHLPTPGYDTFLARIGLPPNTAFGAPADMPFFSDLIYDFKQFAAFGEGTVHLSEQWALTAGLRYYDFKEDRVLTFAGLFVDAPYLNEPGSTKSDGFSPRAILSFDATEDVQLNAQVSRGFRLGGINDPLNVGLCTDDDLIVYGGHPNWDDEKVTNYELGAKTRVADGRVTFNASVFYSDIESLQVIADAGSCSSRIVLNADAKSVGGEIEMFARPSENWDFGVSATYADAKITKTQLDANGNPIAGIRDGNRLPTSPKLQTAASGTYSFPLMANDGFLSLTYQHVGSSYTQLADQEFPFGCVGCVGAPGFIPFGDPTISQVTFRTKLPAYDIGNIRLGVRGDEWEAALFVNNVTDERAFLSVDRERGTRARVGYLTNQPRTFGVSYARKF